MKGKKKRINTEVAESRRGNGEILKRLEISEAISEVRRGSQKFAEKRGDG